MPKRKISDKTYTERARKLRSLGYNVPKNLSSSAKRKITSTWKQKAYYYATNEEANRFEFKRFGRNAARNEAIRKATSREQQFPRGVYVQRPRGIDKGNWTWKANADGTITIKAKRGGKWIVDDLIIPLDMASLASDPKAGLEESLRGRKKPRQLMLTVNGIESSAFEDLEAFERYCEETLIPKLEAKEFNFDKYGKEVFGLRLVYSPKGARKARGEGKTFDFTSGGIFDEGSKRIYGRKRYESKETWRPKPGKKRGK